MKNEEETTTYRVLVGETIFEIDECHGCPAASQITPTFRNQDEMLSLCVGDGGQRHMHCHYGPSWVGYPTPVEEGRCPRIVKNKERTRTKTTSK